MATQKFSISIGNYIGPRPGVNRVIVVSVGEEHPDHIVIDDTIMGLQLSDASMSDVENLSLIYSGRTSSGIITLSSVSTGVYQLNISDLKNPILIV
jgi:hypothetical protein